MHFELKTGYRREEVINRTVDELGIWVDYSERGKLADKIVRGEPIRNVEASAIAKSYPLVRG
jgi:hypothetical protein